MKTSRNKIAVWEFRNKQGNYDLIVKPGEIFDATVYMITPQPVFEEDKMAIKFQAVVKDRGAKPTKLPVETDLFDDINALYFSIRENVIESSKWAWEKIISVNIHHFSSSLGTSRKANIDFAYSVGWRAKVGKVTYYKSGEDDPREETAMKRGWYETRPDDDKDVIYPWSEETERVLEMIAESIDELRDRLQTLNKKQGLANLLAVKSKFIELTDKKP